MKIELSALSDVGLKRENNEDAILLWDLVEQDHMGDGGPLTCSLDSNPCLLVVSDGMGGATAGQVASQTAVESLAEYSSKNFKAKLLDKPEELVKWLVKGIEHANRSVVKKSQRDSSLKGMGATLTVAAAIPGRLLIAHVGDSRLYHLRDGRIRQLTVDHTFVQRLVAMGQVSPAEAKEHAQRHLLVQAIGSGKQLEIDRLAAPILPGDRVMLCSDGLYDLVAGETIVGILSTNASPSDQCGNLVEAAKQAGGDDNISVIVAHVG